MAHFLIYIPEAVNVVAPKALTDVGLADFARGCESIPVSPGPEEKPGLLCAWRRPGKNERMHYNPTEQTWIPALPNGPDGAGRGRYWVGFHNDSPCTPEDCKRSFQIYGPLVQLGDGNQWRIPVLDEVPKDFVCGEDGSWQEVVQAEYHDLWMECLDWRGMIDNKTISATVPQILDFSVKVLRRNYRITREVVSHLKIFNSENLSRVFAITLNRILQGTETP